jgi:hypothetical protein
MAYDPSIFNINPYYDDFSADKGFLRVLFKPGYAVQARELTQIQTILQDQLSTVGNYLFKDGSRIVGGGLSVRNSSYIMVNVGAGTALDTLAADQYPNLVGGILSYTDSVYTVQAKIVHYLAPEEDGNLILVVDFISGDSFPYSVCTFTKEDVTYSLTLVSSTTAGYTTSGGCKLITVSDGLFYVDGFFVRTATQQFAPYQVLQAGNATSYRDLNFTAFADLSKKIGFAVNRDFVIERQDSTLRDPAIGSYNYNAPGADRYSISLVLAQSDLDETLNDFVELLRFESGKITKKIDRITYGEIQKALALRTYDESGSYTVRPFDLTVKPYDTTNHLLSVGEGKAYVLGYDVENQYPQGLTLPKAQTTSSTVSTTFPFSTGLYMGVCMGNTASSGTTFAANLPTISSGSAYVDIRNAANITVATGLVHGAFPTNLERTGSAAGKTGYYYRLYLYGVSGSVVSGRTGFIYQHGTPVGRTLWGTFTPQVSTGFTLAGTDDSSLLYELKPGYAIKDVSSLSVRGRIVGTYIDPTNPNTTTTTYTIKKENFASTIGSSNTGMFSFENYGSTPNSSAEISKIAFTNADNIAFAPAPSNSVVYTDSGNIVLTVTGAPAGFTAQAVRPIVPIVYSPTISSTSTYRTKTSTPTSAAITTNNYSTDGNGRKFFTLPNIDVYSISGVSYSATPFTDVTSHFELDDGQRETHYDNSRLYVKEAFAGESIYTSTNIGLTVRYSYFAHGGLAAAPFIGQHSYLNLPYEQIPLYTSPRTGKTVSLANCLDFRHSGLTNSTEMIKPYGVYEGLANTAVTYDHYLPRTDKLCVKADPEDGSALFFIVQGTPDLAPMAPPDPADALVLATLTVPAYTHNATDVVVTPVDTKRFTMADIGKIQKRVDEVEVFAKLSLSESEIEARSLRGTCAAAEPLKTSIFSDEFYGHSISDVTDSQNSCSIDYERGELRPFFTTANITLPTASATNTVVSTDGLLTLGYTTVPHIQNTQYTPPTKVKINPSNTVNWLGFMKLSPSVDPYYDTGYRPVVKTNALMENDNWLSCNSNDDRGFGTQWNEWESLWTGIEQVEEEQDDIQKRMVELPHVQSVSAVPSFNSGSVRVGVNRKVESIDQKNSNYITARQLKNRIKHRIGSRVVDRSVVPYIPLKTVTATVNGLKPNATGLSVYFDGEVVKSGISTDAYGSCTVSFGISAGAFLAGQRTVRISDSAVTANSTIAAEATYYCTGLIEQRVAGSYSTRPPELRRQTPASESVAKDPFNRDIDSVENTHWSDPLSQTFFVDKKTNSDGIFVNSVNLYFSGKDSALPVTVQIRPTVSGYPSPSVVLPFSTVTKLPATVNANATAPTVTGFTFSSPVYLEPGEYSLCVLANSDDYELFAADASVNSTQTSGSDAGRAGNNQLVGTLFTTQGIGPAVANTGVDLMFALNRCEFSSSTGTAVYSSVPNCTNSQVIKMYAPELLPSSCTVSRTLGSVAFKNNESVYLNTLYTTAPVLTYSLTRGADTTVSPVVDTAALYGTSVKMFAVPNTPVSRYVSRVVELADSSASNGLAVFLDANIPSSSTITVSYRASLNGEGEVFSKGWIPLTRSNPTFTSTSEIDFREAVYRGTLPSGQFFKSYQIRVDLTPPAANSTYYQTPAVRTIRTVSFIQ